MLATLDKPKRTRKPKGAAVVPERLTDGVTLYQGDCLTVLKTLPAESVNCCITSPPYFGLRDYGADGQIGLERTPDKFVAKLVAVFAEVRRVLRDDGTLWLNLGDSYNAYNGGAGPSSALSKGNQTTARPKLETGYGLRFKGLKPKDLIGIPWRVAFALQDDGWYLRQDIIWHKPNPMPESVTDRCTKSHEYLFLLAKSERYHYDAQAIAEPAAFAGQMNGGSSSRYKQNSPVGMDYKVYQTRNKRSVWTVQTEPYHDAHFATFPTKLIEPCILAGCPKGGVVLDPFNGAGTTGAVSILNGRKYVGIELNPDYLAITRNRLLKADGTAPGTLFADIDTAPALFDGL